MVIVILLKPFFISCPFMILYLMAHLKCFSNNFGFIYLLFLPPGGTVPDDPPPTSGAVHHAGQPLSACGPEAWQTTLH